MAVSLPYPNNPKNGDAPDATPILANIQALQSGINSFDGSGINTGTIFETAFSDAVNPRLRDGAWMYPWIEVGGYSSGFTGLTWTMPAGYAWYNGYRSLFPGQSYTVVVNTDTYFSVSQSGAVTQSAVANGAAQPTVPANSQFVAKVISNATTITSVVDLRAPSPNTLGIAKNTTGFSTASTVAVQVTGLSLAINVLANSRPIKITVFTIDQYNAGTGVVGSSLSIWDGAVGTGTQLASNLVQQSAAGATCSGYCLSIGMLSPGPHTINVGFRTTNTANTASFDASPTTQAILLVEAL